jgi:hypothetical protein
VAGIEIPITPVPAGFGLASMGDGTTSSGPAHTLLPAANRVLANATAFPTITPEGFSPARREVNSSSLRVGTIEGINVSLPSICTPIDNSVEELPSGLANGPK